MKRNSRRSESRKRKRAPCGRRIETLFVFNDPLDLPQHRADLRLELQGPCRRHHLTALLDEKIVAEQLAQPCEGRAHAGLPDAEQLTRPRDMTCPHQGVERNQQVEIDTAEIHGCSLVYGARPGRSFAQGPGRPLPRPNHPEGTFIGWLGRGRGRLGSHSIKPVRPRRARPAESAA